MANKTDDETTYDEIDRIPRTRVEERYWELHALGREDCLKCPYDHCIFDFAPGTPGRNGPCLIFQTTANSNPDRFFAGRNKLLMKLAKIIERSRGAPLTFREAARRLDVPSSTLAAWKRNGYIIAERRTPPSAKHWSFHIVAVFVNGEIHPQDKTND